MRTSLKPFLGSGCSKGLGGDGHMTITPVTTSSQWRLIPKTSCTICIDRGNEEDFVEDHLEFETPTNYVGTL